MFDLNITWFILIGTIFTVFFCLEGFDYGVGMISFKYRKNKKKFREVIDSIAPFWDGNEVWMITAGGAIFAAFPVLYAVMFSGLYIPLTLLLVALISRVFSFELIHQDQKEEHHGWATWGIFLGSIVPAFLWGVAMYTLIGGSAIDNKDGFVFTASWISILSIQSLLAGIGAVITFYVFGALYLQLKLDWEDMSEITAIIKKVTPIWLLVAIAFFISNVFVIDFKGGAINYISIVLWLGLLIANAALIKRISPKMGFIAMILFIVASNLLLFGNLFPNLMISNIDPIHSLNIMNASSSQYTLKLMTIAAFIFVPMILTYQFTIYWIFSKKD